jgi:hypothetical protein
MAARSSKKQLILECGTKFGGRCLGIADLRRVQQDLREAMSPAKPPSLGYITNVLRQAGMRVDYEDRYTDPLIPERYAGRLEGALRFDDLAAAQAALKKLNAAYHDYESVSDHAGASLVRKLVVRGRQRAESMAANVRVRLQKREEKREIAAWFRVWLESPDLFFDWLEVRKHTDEFRRMFPFFAEELIEARSS